MPSEFKHGLFGCFGSMKDCCIGYFCPCIHAYIASKSTGQETVWNALQCVFYPLLVPLLRNQAREKSSIQGSVIGDLAAGWCCPCCTTIQIKRQYD